MNKLQKNYEQHESTISSQTQELYQLRENNKHLEVKLSECQKDLSEIRAKFQNSSVFIHHSCKANTLLKEEKDSLEKILQDNAFKLKSLKYDYDQINEKYMIIETDYNKCHLENDLLNKKITELKHLNEVVTNEKIAVTKVFNIILGYNGYCSKNYLN